MLPRREAIERLSLILGGTLSAELTAAVMGQVVNPGGGITASGEQTALIAELADVIIPDTDTPGAKAAGVEAFIVRVMRDCYELPEQEKFFAGLAEIDAAAVKGHGKAFVALGPAEKTAIVAGATKSNPAFFRRMRELTVTGYFISEIGATQALEYLPVPGRFEGDVPLQPGQKAWAISR